MVSINTRHSDPLTHDCRYTFAAPIVLFYGERDPRVKAVKTADSLFRLLNRIGRERAPIRQLIQGEYALAARSLRTLNCFLHSGRGLRFRPWRCELRYASDWSHICALLALSWQPLPGRN